MYKALCSLKYSGHTLSTKNLLSMLTDSSRFHIDSNFEQLKPIYKVTPVEIELYLQECVKKSIYK